MKKNIDPQNNSEVVKTKPVKVRRFPKFSIIDAVIILLVIAIVVGIYFRYSFFDTLNSTRNIKECYVTFKTQNTTETQLDALAKDDLIYFKSDKSAFGTLTVESEEKPLPILTYPATNDVTLYGKTYLDVEYPQNVENPLIYGTGIIKCECSITDDGSYLLNGSTYIAAGQTYTVCTEKVTIEITITSIEEALKN